MSVYFVKCHFFYFSTLLCTKVIQNRLDMEVALLQMQQRLSVANSSIALGVEGRVQQLIQVASCDSNLMWMPPEWEAWL